MRAFSKTTLLGLIALLVIGGSFFIGVYTGYENRPEIDKVTTLLNKESGVVFDSQETDFDPFWKAWNSINEKYAIDNGTTTDQDKVWGAIQGLVKSLEDPYSVFLPPDDSEIFEENISGNFGGVGMEIGIRDNVLTVIAPLKDTPAERAGILSGDKIIEVDGTLTIDLSIDKAVKLIRGEVGTPVLLTIVRENGEETQEIEIIRDIITIPTIDTEERDDGIFVIQLYNFSATSPNLFQEALREFILSGGNKLILDVRGNAGGFLQAAVDIASWFLPTGKTIVIEDFGEREENIVYRSRGYDVFNENLKMIILVNGGSASASEILAGALSEHGIAKLVGSKTFGKGSVQELIKITPETSLKLTVAHWKTPQGKSISKDGLTPEFEVEITEDDREEGRDPQLEKAIELLLE